MKRLLLLIIMIFNLMLLQAQRVEFISVNQADTSLQNITLKSLQKHLQKETLTADTLTTPTKWMVKLQKKLTKEQRADSNIYIFFCPTLKDSLKSFVPLSGKYGYVLFNTAKGGVVELEKWKLRLSTWKYQWDLLHNPEKILFAWAQDEEEGAMVIENSTRALARLIKTINCAHNNGEKEVKLYFPTSTITASVSGLVSELYLAGNPCTEDAEVKATLYEMFGEVVDLGNDYLEDVFSLEDIGYDESTKIITITGNKYKLFITGEKDALCAYNFAKNNLFGSLHVPRTPINFASLEDLQYASPCEIEYLSIDSRKDLLQKIQSETNWYNGSLKDSRQKITINVIATTPKEDRGDLLTFFSSNTVLLKTLYERIDDYRGEFIGALNNIYQDGLESLSGNKVVALGLQPGVIEQGMPWYEDLSFMWGYLYTIKKHTYAEYVSADKISVYIKEYRGISIGREALMADGQLLCEGSPFDVIKGVKLESGKQVNIPLFYFLYKAEEGEADAMYKDIGALGEKSVDLALIVFGLKNLQGASSLLKAEVTAQNVARLLLGFADLTTLGLGEICENGTSEFCQTYREYEFYINMGLLSANILNEFPQIYKNLKKGLDDPALTKGQKDGLRKVLGETEDIIQFSKGKTLSVYVNKQGKSFNCIVESVRPGTNGKYVVMGRSMAPVSKVADDLKALGLEVRILDDAYLGGQKFKLGDYEYTLPTGKKVSYKAGYKIYDKQNKVKYTLKGNDEWTVDMAWNDMANNPAYDDIKDIEGFINNVDDLENLPMYKLNKQWIEKMKGEGYEVINIGNPTNEVTESLFFNMEKSMMDF